MAGPYVGLVGAEPRDTWPHLITLDGTLDALICQVQKRKQLALSRHHSQLVPCPEATQPFQKGTPPSNYTALITPIF